MFSLVGYNVELTRGGKQSSFHSYPQDQKTFSVQTTAVCMFQVSCFFAEENNTRTKWGFQNPTARNHGVVDFESLSVINELAILAA